MPVFDEMPSLSALDVAVTRTRWTLRRNAENHALSRSYCRRRTLYLFLDAVELHHLDDKRGGAPFVLDGPQQRPHVVHAEGLRPAPVPPSLDADV